jgi:hypothetical protein
VIAVPFEGEAEFFKIQPNRYGSAPPRAEIGDGVLLLRYVSAGSRRGRGEARKRADD